MHSTPLTALLALFVSLAVDGCASSQTQDASTSRPSATKSVDTKTESTDWNVEDLFARSIVIDGNVNYYSSRTGSEIGQPDFDHDKLGRSVKQSTGINIGAITCSTAASMDAQRNQVEGRRLRSGEMRPPTFKGAMLIRTAKGLDAAIAENKYGVLLYCQTHYLLRGSTEPLQDYYDRGLRVWQLQYGGHDINQGPLEKLGDGNDQSDGLTELGTKVVHELMRLHMVVDLSHCCLETKLDTCKIAMETGLPVTANHSAARNVKMKNGKFLARYTRNITDEGAKAIAKTGGVVAVMAYSGYLSGPYQKLRRSSPTRNTRPSTIDDYVAHIDYLVKLIGADHVGLSTDGYLDGKMAHDRKGDGILDAPIRWKVCIERLHGLGYTDEDLQKIMGLNFLRVYRKILE